MIKIKMEENKGEIKFSAVKQNGELYLNGCLFILRDGKLILPSGINTEISIETTPDGTIVVERFYSFGRKSDYDSQYALIEDLKMRFNGYISKIILEGKSLGICLKFKEGTDEWREFIDYCIGIEGDFVKTLYKYDGMDIIWEFD